MAIVVSLVCLSACPSVCLSISDADYQLSEKAHILEHDDFLSFGVLLFCSQNK